MPRLHPSPVTTCVPGALRRLALSAAAALALACRDGAAARPPASDAGREVAPALDVSSWLRLGPGELGCVLERRLGRADPSFGCGRRLPALPEDPCEDERAWRSGPLVPDAPASKLHPALRHVELAWEGGELQRATFTFAPGTSPAAMAAAVGDRGGALDEAARHGPGTCELPCYEVLVFQPTFFECVEEDEEEGGERPGAER